MKVSFVLQRTKLCTLEVSYFLMIKFYNYLMYDIFSNFSSSISSEGSPHELEEVL